MPFGDIKGHRVALDLLTGDLRSGKLAGAYFLSGQEGLGKFFAARTFAKAINCLSFEADSCGSCSSCRKIDKQEHPDVHFLEPEGASEALKIESVRQMQQKISLRPYEGKKTVVVIREAHTLTSEAANALLKTLEEPPQHAVFILTSSRQALMFKTIVSRCRLVRFAPLQRHALEEILRDDFSVPQPRAHFLAYFSEGRIGHALALRESSLLEQKNRIIDEFIFSSQGQAGSVKERQDARVVLNVLATWFRDLYLVKTGLPHSELINLDRRDELLGFINRYGWSALERIIGSISESLFYLEHNVNTRLLLSNMRAHICQK
mgnify:CR=1 FL=1